ncbi:pre-peptidase C-terminal domain-containing protein [Nostocaceae cyanobacterium CENA369]|uniref:Pre-peptidase C-terminal domain-containing protein n=1 Tax=Dendronalium phyllosphericum CENA369 TaxID=1725256 RepID=A0A8J7I092_9NOST|nr:PPC domain-containing protein [Dendronalium phyllosphericum]MBH8571713.1 pre-peptidase C-terminal domain-containing protein [Dendronalium phyllosphericum CENA369]
MAEQGNKKHRFRFKLALIFSMSSMAIAASYILPISAIESPKYSEEFRLAKTPDEREPDAVQQGIDQIPTSQPPVSPQPNQTIDSPIPANVPSSPENTAPTPQSPEGGSTPAPSAPIDSNPTPQPSPDNSTPAPSTPRNSNPTPQPSQNNTPRPSRNRNSYPTPQPSPNNSTPRPSRPINSKPIPQPTGGRKPVTLPTRNGNPNPESSPVSQIPNAKQINFVDIAFGILSKGDYKSKGRYFHFYQFEGRENQLIQIRLVGSADQRRSNNLSLRPFMFLLDPNNNVVLKRSSTQTNDDAFIFARLPMKGTYTIAVTSQNPGDTGRYSLALRNDRASYSLDESDRLTAQSSTLKQNGSPYNVSKFEGKKNQLVSIRVDSVNEEFSPYIVLLNSQGEKIAVDNEKDGVYSAFIDRAKLPKDDTYYVIVTSNNPRERGTYRLTIF